MFTEHKDIYQLSDGVLTHHHLYYHHYCYYCYLYYHYYDYYYCYYYRYYQWVHVMWSELCVNIQNSSGLYRWRGSNLNSWTFFDSHIKLIIFSFTSFLMFYVWICKWWKPSVREHRDDWNRQTAEVKQWTHFKGMDRKVLSQHFETKSVFNSQISLHQLITDMKTVILLFKFSDDDDWNIQMRPSKSYMSKTEIWTKIKTFFSERRHVIATTLLTTIPTILCCDSTPTHSREDESTSEVCVDVEPNIDLTTRTGLWNLSSCWTVEHLLLLCLLSGPKN